MTAATTREHELKCWPQFYEPILTGLKTFEFRKFDRGFSVGDTIKLRECDKGVYSGRETRRRITYILDVNRWRDGHYVCLSIVPLEEDAMLNQEQINSMFEARISRLEKYLQKEGHDITSVDGPAEPPSLEPQDAA